jgi:hypothetical protein
MHRKAEEESHSGVLWATTRTQRGGAYVKRLRMLGTRSIVIISVFARRLKPGHSFDEFVAEWEADEGFGVPTRVFNGISLEDPCDVVSVGFVAVSPDELKEWLATGSGAEQVRHERIDTVVESTKLRAMFELKTEHNFSGAPQEILLGSEESLLANMGD